jgi:hypothetical protein
MRTSSVIASLEYNPASRTLEVEFHSGRMYQYFGVPKSEYQALLKAPSLGGYFNREIKPRYRAKEIVRHKRSA